MRARIACALTFLLGASTVLGDTTPATPVDAALAERFAPLALGCVHREYPNKIAHVMSTDDDAQPPRRLTPAFFGDATTSTQSHTHDRKGGHAMTSDGLFDHEIGQVTFWDPANGFQYSLFDFLFHSALLNFYFPYARLEQIHFAQFMEGSLPTKLTPSAWQ